MTWIFQKISCCYCCWLFFCSFKYMVSSLFSWCLLLLFLLFLFYYYYYQNFLLPSRRSQSDFHSGSHRWFFLFARSLSFFFILHFISTTVITLNEKRRKKIFQKRTTFSFIYSLIHWNNLFGVDFLFHPSFSNINRFPQ